MEVTKQENRQLEPTWTQNQHSMQWISIMLKTEVADLKLNAKIELSSVVSHLMPVGKPQFLDVVKYPKITDLVKDHGRAKMHKVIFLMVKDFCSSMNVVRNMNDDQMIEAAGMLIDEAD